jgi:predicted acyl esterase
MPPRGKAGAEEGSVSARLIEDSAVAAYFVAHGYAIVYQDCRGRYGSEGSFTKYLSEANDGADTIHLLGARPPFGPLAEREDVLSFATPPLAADLVVAGPVELELWVTCDTPDAGPAKRDL